MTFRTDCRFLGGLADVKSNRRICALTSALITSCTGCNTFKNVNEPCEVCAVFQVCQKQSKRRAAASFNGIAEPEFDDSRFVRPANMGENKKHLIYHIWPRSGNGTWQWNVGQLLRRIDLFDGVRTIGIVTGGNADSIETVKAEFGNHRIDNWVIAENNPQRGEGVTFREMLMTLPFDGSTFYAHAKGVKHDPPNSAIRTWSDIMYRACLERIDLVDNAISTHSTVGCFRNYYDPEMPFKHFNWHFAGTFFWFRNREAFARQQWKIPVGGYYQVEMWPGQLFEPNDAACIFADGQTEGYGLYSPEVMDRYNELAKSLEI